MNPSQSICVDCLKVRIPENTHPEKISAVTGLLRFFEGTDPVYLYHNGSIQKNFRVFFNRTLLEELVNLLGEANVKYEKIPVK